MKPKTVSVPVEIPLVDACVERGLSYNQLWRLMLQGVVIGRRHGGRWLVDRASLARFSARQKVATEGASNAEND